MKAEELPCSDSLNSSTMVLNRQLTELHLLHMLIFPTLWDWAIDRICFPLGIVYCIVGTCCLVPFLLVNRSLSENMRTPRKTWMKSRKTWESLVEHGKETDRNQFCSPIRSQFLPRFLQSSLLFQPTSNQLQRFFRYICVPWPLKFPQFLVSSSSFLEVPFRFLRRDSQALWPFYPRLKMMKT